MRIMTFNIRFENDRDGENGWSYRKDLVVKVITRYKPAIVGTQEGTVAQLEYLRDRLSGYSMHAPPARTLDATCQYPTLFYRNEECQLIDGGEFWLSRTPEVHRSKDWDSAFPRMMSYGLFRDLRNGRETWVVVTHLDHVGAEARREQAKTIVRWVKERNAPHIVIGDFNDVPGSPVHSILTFPETNLRDTWQLLGREEDETGATHHGFAGVPQAGRIDWILVSPHFDVIEAVVINVHCQGRYPSDHYPYVADLRWA